MSTQAVFNGVTYSIPEKGEVGWFDLSDYLYALSGAATTSSMVYAVTTVTASPYTPSTTDMTIAVNLTVAGPTSIVFPSGTAGRFLLVVDKKGDAETNNITITPAALQTIGGGASYVIATNNGSALFQFDSVASNWMLISEIKILDKSQVLADDATTTLLFSTKAHAFTISDELGRTLYCASEYLSDKITCLSDKNDLFRPTDDDGYYYVFKSANSNTISVKNRTGGSRTIQIKIL